MMEEDRCLIQHRIRPFIERSGEEGEEEEESDFEFLLKSFDSALPYLESIGSGSQWGRIPFSERPKFVEEMTRFCEASTGSYREGKEKWLLLSEVEVGNSDPSLAPPSSWLRNGFVGFSLDSHPTYFSRGSELFKILDQVKEEGGSYFYIHYLVSDRRREGLNRGVGGRLIREVVGMAGSKGIGRIFCDCWGGNGGGLVRFYESQGFKSVGEFSVDGKHDPGMVWEGHLLEMRLD
ncbi:hypothetical protein IE53DRAFT_343374 [Violaceomyces palustris]|uniref:Uncharacterized protein n=1 Tax=Violaceomyces palustris TaxID=1673888 RepID=A0ACD0NYD8_9BASI|nr:hypothetical protein IE53DRAFT_343374 [Violaceomyces palustris]